MPSQCELPPGKEMKQRNLYCKRKSNSPYWLCKRFGGVFRHKHMAGKSMVCRVLRNETKIPAGETGGEREAPGGGYSVVSPTFFVNMWWPTHPTSCAALLFVVAGAWMGLWTLCERVCVCVFLQTWAKFIAHNSFGHVLIMNCCIRFPFDQSAVRRVQYMMSGTFIDF